jgi:predicted nucleotidyltransferase component of viral defense system
LRDTIFFKQAELLLRVLPLIQAESVFALKGGTAINFFVRDLPRISVDIDLAYLPVNDRDTALRQMSDALNRISGMIERRVPGTQIVQRKIRGSELLKGMIVRREEVTVKIEPNLVLRGAVYEPETRLLCTKAQELFELSMEIRTLSIADLYGGKTCAALDRQHPRDLFDIRVLLSNEGFPKEIRKAFIVYLISHDRPIFELLNPNPTDISPIFEKEFRGMVTEPVTCEELAETRQQLIERISAELSVQEKQFIVSVKEGRPQWELLGLEGVENLPAVRWKLENIAKINPDKHEKAVRRLRDYLKV